MQKLTAEKCREQFEYWAARQPEARRYGYAERDGYGGYTYSWYDNAWRIWQASREAIEIALPVLEQQGAKKQISLREGIEASRKFISESGGYNFDALRAEQERERGEEE